MKPLSVALVGAGYMGSLHAAKVAALRDVGEGVILSGVADIDPARARELASKLDTRAVTDFRQLLPGSDAAIVAVPTLRHFEVVREVLEAGLDVLVEKPIAATVGEAEDLLGIAAAGGRVLQVGHVEWFNAALRAIRDRIRRPRFVEAHRIGPFPNRATDVDVVRDLMIHDLDILQQLLGEAPERVEAVGVPVVTSSCDIASARISFPSGCVANLTASRVSNRSMRTMRLFQRDGYFSIDFLDQSAVVYRPVESSDGSPWGIRMQSLAVGRGDALLEQLRAFLRAIRTREKPTADGSGGLGALRTALRVIDAMPPMTDGG